MVKIDHILLGARRSCGQSKIFGIKKTQRREREKEREKEKKWRKEKEKIEEKSWKTTSYRKEQDWKIAI